MLAIVYDRYGPPEELRLADVRTPAPKPNEVRVRVLATTVNRTDVGFRRGEPWIARFWSGLAKPRFPILGSEFAGIVDAVGAKVMRFKAGDPATGLIGRTFGAHAEYVCVAEDAPIVRTPSHLRPDEATALWDGPWLALACLRKAKVRQGTRLLVYGASGSIGSSAVQLAKHFGAEITAVCTPNTLELARSLGAAEAIDHTTTDFTELDRTFDVVLDAVGKSTFGRCKRLLTPNGQYVSTDLGPGWQNPWLELWTRLARGKQAGLAIPDEKRVREDVMFLCELAEKRELVPVVDRVYRLADIVEAYRFVETEQKVGSVVISVG
jgi:NADPH:quinone reductase-like Zn-dependent oxidoreductase